VDSVVHRVIRITFRKKGLCEARIAELIYMVFSRKTGVPSIITEESSVWPLLPTKQKIKKIMKKLGKIINIQK
jgi:hypothetical protein